MTQDLAEMVQRRSTLDQELGKQDMQRAVLKWAVDNASKLIEVGLLDSLVAAMDSVRSK